MGHGICLAWDCPFRRSKNYSKSSDCGYTATPFYQTAATRLAPPPGLQVLAHVFQQRQRPIAAIQDVPERMIQKSVHMVHENWEYREYMGIPYTVYPHLMATSVGKWWEAFFGIWCFSQHFQTKPPEQKPGHHLAIGFQGVSSIKHTNGETLCEGAQDKGLSSKHHKGKPKVTQVHFRGIEQWTTKRPV